MREESGGEPAEPVVPHSQTQFGIGAAVADERTQSGRREIDRDNPGKRRNQRNARGNYQVPESREHSARRADKVHHDKSGKYEVRFQLLDVEAQPYQHGAEDEPPEASRFNRSG